MIDLISVLAIAMDVGGDHIGVEVDAVVQQRHLGRQQHCPPRDLKLLLLSSGLSNQTREWV